MPRPLVLLLAGALVACAGVVGVRVVVGSTSLGVDERVLACSTESGAAQVCVVRLSRPELVAIPGRREIQVRRGDDPRALYAEDPFGAHVDDDQLDVELVDGVTVRGPAYALRWDAGEVASLGVD